MREHLSIMLSRAKFAAIGAAVGGGVGGLFSRNSASTGAAIGGLVGAIIGEKRVAVTGMFAEVKDKKEELSLSHNQ